MRPLLPRLSFGAVAATAAPMLLSGCMMGAMGAMGHSTGSAMPSPPAAMESRVSSTSAKVVVGEIGVTVDFRAPPAGDSVVVAVTVVGPGPMSGRDADLTLTIAPASATSHSGEHESVGRARGGAFGAMLLSPVEDGAGNYIFRAVLPNDGPYRLTVGLRRVGARTFEPPIEVAQVWDLSPMMRASGASPHDGNRSGLTPLLLLGAGAMAMMMLFTFR